jgi:hypothetical protein
MHVFFALLCQRTVGSLACAGVVFVSLTVFDFLLPAGKDQYGMPSFPTILRRIAQLWSTKRQDLEEQVMLVCKNSCCCCGGGG